MFAFTVKEVLSVTTHSFSPKRRKIPFYILMEEKKRNKLQLKWKWRMSLKYIYFIKDICICCFPVHAIAYSIVLEYIHYMVKFLSVFLIVLHLCANFNNLAFLSKFYVNISERWSLIGPDSTGLKLCMVLTLSFKFTSMAMCCSYVNVVECSV
jgi:hypothetical protein